MQICYYSTTEWYLFEMAETVPASQGQWLPFPGTYYGSAHCNFGDIAWKGEWKYQKRMY